MTRAETFDAIARAIADATRDLDRAIEAARAGGYHWTAEELAGKRVWLATWTGPAGLCHHLSKPPPPRP